MKKNNNNSHLLKVSLNEQKEKKWDNRFTTLKISEYDSYRDINYLSLGLIKAKLKYEKNEEKKLKRAYSIKESSLNSKNKISSPKKGYILTSKDSKNNNSLSKISPRKYNINCSNVRNKKNYCSKTIPNSCRKMKEDINIKLNTKKEPFSPLYKIRNYSFKENNNKKIKNIIINDIIMKIQGDEKMNELYNNVRELWNEYGVNKIYQNTFLSSLNNYFLSKKLLYEFLIIEKNYMLKFKNEYSLVINKIKQRNNEINKIKKLIKEYSDKSDISLKEEIKNSLKLIRLYTINLVSQIKKFYLINSHLAISRKIDLSKIKVNSIGFDYKYLKTLKSDLGFLKYSSINKIYNFNSFVNDPFLLSLSDISDYDNNIINNNLNYETLPITDEIYNQIIKLLYFINQIDINEKIECQNQKINININNKNNLNKINNYSDNWLTLNNDLDIGNNYQGNIYKIINQLKNKSNYDELFLNSTSSNNNHNNNNKKNKRNFDRLKKLNIFLRTDKNIDIKEINSKNFEEIPITTAEQLKNKFKQYEEIKQIIEEDKIKKI